MIEELKTDRAIRSFARRSGRMTLGQKHALSEYWPLYGIDYELTQANVTTAIQDYESVILEIGFGNGDALIEMAGNAPDVLYIGVEVHRPGVGRCLNIIEKTKLANVRLISYDAIEVMQHMIPAQSLDKVLLFFPDPWHKKRHNKRRIVNQKFRDLAFSLLKPDAHLHFATDWQEYAEYMAEELLSDVRFSNQGDSDGYAQRPDYRPRTRFEQRGLNLGHGVWDLVFKKV
ncbi:MAG: tRNA (guanine-N7-)-methyltransferase [Candidatus Azotimanducaceae bacterium]|jgi:tRNA (guanine-N7-)-methyltransferase